jgi:hypothetical protein
MTERTYVPFRKKNGGDKNGFHWVVGAVQELSEGQDEQRAMIGASTYTNNATQSEVPPTGFYAISGVPWIMPAEATRSLKQADRDMGDDWTRLPTLEAEMKSLYLFP